MNNDFTLNLRAFIVQVQCPNSADFEYKTIVFEKSQLQAAQLIGLSSDNLIKQHFEQYGYTVIKVMSCEKKTISLDLQALYTNGGDMLGH